MRQHQAALGMLAETTPVLVRWFMTFAKPQMTGATAELARARIALLLEFELIIPRMQKLFSKRDIPAQLDWHDLAALLAGGFRKAMLSSNPGLPLRPSNTGPVGRFLIFAIEYVTGETLTPNAIARHLQRREKKAEG